MTLTVGQKLWFVWADKRRGDPHEVTVTRIGRKWAYLDRYETYRIDSNTLAVDGGAGRSSPGHCYLSREGYEASLARNRAWNDLRKEIDRRKRPAGVTVEQIAEARRLLGLPAENEEAW
jgi:hypothetical protein